MFATGEPITPCYHGEDRSFETDVKGVLEACWREGKASFGDARRPRIAVLYSHASEQSREGELSAKYVGLCMAASGQCEKVLVVGLDPGAQKQASPAPSPSLAATSQALRSDGLLIQAETLGSDRYEETLAHQTLAQCHVWILMLDADATAGSLQFLQKRIKKSDAKQPRRVVVSLQTALRQLTQLDQLVADSIVLHGGLGFQVVPNDANVLVPLSQGCYYIERLAAEKVEALFVLDILEGTGLQVLSRRNIQALKWGTTMLRSFYYINALTGESVETSLRDRNIRLLFLEALHEMSTLFARVMQSNASVRRESSGGHARAPTTTTWTPDTIACTYLPVHAIMVLLPLPDVPFHALLRVVDFGLSSSAAATSVTARDVSSNLATSFAAEFGDVFELASGRNMALPALTFLQTTLKATAQARAGVPRIAGSVMVSEVALSPQSRAASRTFLLKLVLTIVATLLLALFLFRK